MSKIEDAVEKAIASAMNMPQRVYVDPTLLRALTVPLLSEIREHVNTERIETTDANHEIFLNTISNEDWLNDHGFAVGKETEYNRGAAALLHAIGDTFGKKEEKEEKTMRVRLRSNIDKWVSPPRTGVVQRWVNQVIDEAESEVRKAENAMVDRCAKMLHQEAGHIFPGTKYGGMLGDAFQSDLRTLEDEMKTLKSEESGGDDV